MSLGPLMVDLAGTELGAEDREVLSHPLIGSVLLFSRNYQNRAQLASLIDSIRRLRSPSLLVAVDHEGGRVQRFREQFTRLPAARVLGHSFDADRHDGLAMTQTAGWLMAAELRSIGIDFSFAPCVDLEFGLSEVIGDRAFHRDPDAVGSLAVAYMAGMREAGMAATAKHFPGHGAVAADSHVALPVDRRTLADLEPDLRPYRLLIANLLPAIMAAHVVYPEVDALPASLSHRWLTGLLRGNLGFHGCIFADDLTMAGAAAFGDVLARARLAAAAGCDVLPICNDRRGVHTVLDKFKPSVVNPASQARLVHMRGRGTWTADLAADARWQAAVKRIRSLDAPPPLVLTEGDGMSDIDLQLLRNLVDASPQAVALVDVQDPDQPVIYVNASFLTLTGYLPEDLVGRNLRILQGKNREQDERHRLREAIASGETCQAILRNYRKDGSAFWNEFSVQPLRNADGKVSHFAAFYREARPDREAPAAIQPAHSHGMLRDDRLTGLYSWPYLEELLKRDWAIAQRDRHSLTVFSIDIDALELYNTTFGRGAGDSTIRRVGHCIAGCLRRASDATARLDGGSFLAFAVGLSAEQAQNLGKVVAERVRDLRIHHPRCTVLRFISVSIGVANAVPEKSQTYESLVQHANRRLLAAKQSGRNTVC